MARTHQVLHSGRAGAWLREEVLKDLEGLGSVVAREAAVDYIVPSKAVSKNAGQHLRFREGVGGRARAGGTLTFLERGVEREAVLDVYAALE